MYTQSHPHSLCVRLIKLFAKVLLLLNDALHFVIFCMRSARLLVASASLKQNFRIEYPLMDHVA